MDHELRRELVTALLRVPGMEHPATRTALLPPGVAHRLDRYEPNATVDLERILDQLAQADAPSLISLLDNALARVVGAELRQDLTRLQERLRAALLPRQLPAFHRVPSWSFDLVDIVKTCLRARRQPPGLFGYGIRPFPLDYPDNLVRRLQAELRSAEVRVLGSLGEGMLDERQGLLERIETALLAGKSNVIIAARATDPDRAARFWQRLRDHFEGKLTSWLFFVLTMPPHKPFPEAITALPEPRFEPEDMHMWATQLVQDRLTEAETDRFARSLTDYVARKCTGPDAAADGDEVYRFLRRLQDLFQDKVPLDELYLRIEMWG